MSLVNLVNSLHKDSFYNLLTEDQSQQLYGAFSWMSTNQGHNFWFHYANQNRNIDEEFIRALISVCHLLKQYDFVPKLESLLKPATIQIDKQYEELYT